MDSSTPVAVPDRPPAQLAGPATSTVSTLRRMSGGVRFRLRTTGIEPALRLLGFAAGAGVRELAGRLGDLLADRSHLAARRDERQRRAAERLARTLGDLKGAFVKLGQFAALRYDVLPPPVREALASLHDRVPPLPFETALRVIESELGRPLGEAYAAFDPEPLGAASIAQVYRARLPSGEDVAVKVQHPWLEASIGADLALLRGALAVWTALTGRSRETGRRLFDEFASTLREELDFEREAAVAREIAANLAFEPQIVVPEVVAGLTARRVLTMRFHVAVGIADRAGLARIGVAPGAVLAILARAYAKQVFVDGLFHADPHPGNLFVLDEPGAATRPRVLFIDFGLSRRLDPALRDELRRGIFALLQRDLDAFVAGMERMGMIAPGAHETVRSAVRSMFERMAQESASALALSGDRVLSLKDHAKALLQETAGLQLPNDLLLYARTLSYLFALGAQLDPSLNLLEISLPYLMRFLAGQRD